MDASEIIRIYGPAECIVRDPEPYNGTCTLHTDLDMPIAYAVIFADGGIDEFEIYCDGRLIYTGSWSGDSAAVPMNGVCAGTLDFKVTKASGDYKVKSVAVYEVRYDI